MIRNQSTNSSQDRRSNLLSAVNVKHKIVMIQCTALHHYCTLSEYLKRYLKRSSYRVRKFKACGCRDMSLMQNKKMAKRVARHSSTETTTQSELKIKKEQSSEFFKYTEWKQEQDVRWAWWSECASVVQLSVSRMDWDEHTEQVDAT